jgi:hypothetical protein
MKTTIIFLTSLLMTSLGLAQTKQLRGLVTDVTIPMPGMNVVELGTSNGTATNADGEFALMIPDDKEVYLLVAGTDIRIYVKVDPDDDYKKISLRGDLKLRKESRKIKKEWEAKTRHSSHSR